MAGPWERFQQPAEVGPWAAFAASPPAVQPPASTPQRVTLGDVGARAVQDLKEAGSNIYNTVRNAVMLPGDVAAGKFDVKPAVPGMVSDEEEALRQHNDAVIFGRTLDLAGVGSPISASARAGEMAVPGVMKALKPAKVEPPSAEALKQAADAGYKSARDMGVVIKPEHVHNMSFGVQNALEQDGIIGELAPKTFSILSKLQQAPEGSFATIGNLEAARRALGHAAGDFTNPTERLAASRAIDGLDEFLGRLPQEDAVAGPVAAVAKVLEEARANYGAAKRSEKVTGAAETAELNAAVANSGQNLDNATRQRIKSILVKPKEARGYSQEELAQMERVARGGAGANTARYVGNFLGGGGGLGGILTGAVGASGGATVGGPVGAAVGAAAPLVGMAAKQIANLLTGREVKNLDKLVRSRSPLHDEIVRSLPMQTQADPKRMALVRALLAARDQ